MENGSCILGAGITGLAAGWTSGLPVYEARDFPGGICASYSVDTGGRRIYDRTGDSESYRFGIAGGVWIHSADPVVLRFVTALTSIRSYERRAAVFFPKQNLRVPYPLQNHLSHLDKAIAAKALLEMANPPRRDPNTMSDWLETIFGPTLTQLFFGPFHELYTAGLWRQIAPQDSYKSPLDFSNVLRGAFGGNSAAGYNRTFIYPLEGLGTLAKRMADGCRVRYGSKVSRINVDSKELVFADGTIRGYDRLISTLPLNRMMELTGLAVDADPDPYSSVLVLNIGGVPGLNCPDEHWLYIPDSAAGFHRVGFYSNVDSLFLPRSAQDRKDKVSLYVEKAFRGGNRPAADDISRYTTDVISELKTWGWLSSAEVIDPSWIELGYAWSYPGSKWRADSLRRLQEVDIVMCGRYGKWICQAVSESIRDGFCAGALGKLA